MHNHSDENDFNLHVNEISISYEKMGTKTHFEEEAKGNSEMAYSDDFCLVKSTKKAHIVPAGQTVQSRCWRKQMHL